MFQWNEIQEFENAPHIIIVMELMGSIRRHWLFVFPLTIIRFDNKLFKSSLFQPLLGMLVPVENLESQLDVGVRCQPVWLEPHGALAAGITVLKTMNSSLAMAYATANLLLKLLLMVTLNRSKPLKAIDFTAMQIVMVVLCQFFQMFVAFCFRPTKKMSNWIKRCRVVLFRPGLLLLWSWDFQCQTQGSSESCAQIVSRLSNSKV